MMVKDIISVIERVAPLRLQEDYDNSGMQVGDTETEVSGVLTCLDVTEQEVDEAIGLGANLIVSHHPLIFRGLKKITEKDYIGRTILKAIHAGISIYAAHTNLDNADGGVNYRMAEVLGLQNVKPLASLPAEKTAGMENPERCGSGAIGELAEAMTIGDFVGKVNAAFNCGNCIRINDAPDKKIKTVALCGGSGADFIAEAERVGADAFVTGEIGYHRFFGHENILLVEAGHYETEQYTCDLLKEIIEKAFPEVKVIISKQL